MISIYSFVRGAVAALPGIFSVLIFLLPSVAQSQNKYYSKEEDGKWGILMEHEVYSKKEKKMVTEEKWHIKPQWDRVWVDTARYGCHNSCDGFITYRNGKYGYVWVSGKSFDNVYDRLDISRHVAKKNGRWGGFSEDVQVLPFEHDTLLFDKFATGHHNRDTTYLGFIGKKNNKWQVLTAKTVNGVAAGHSFYLPKSFDECYTHSNGVVVRSGSRWQYIDISNFGKPIYSAECDSIKEVLPFLGIKKDGKWYLVNTYTPVTGSEKAWDNVEATDVSNYIAVWENGKAGVMYYDEEWHRLKEVISPRGATVKVYWKTNRDDIVIELAEGDKKVMYDKNAKVKNMVGDLTVANSTISGPFRIDLHDDMTYTVYNAADNTVLVPRSKASPRPVNDPMMGHVLYLEEFQSSTYTWYGLYHYNTKQLIKERYLSPFESITADYLAAGSKNVLIDVWDKRTMKKVTMPFKVHNYSNSYGQSLLVDDAGRYHKAKEPFDVVPPYDVILSRDTVVSGIEREFRADGTKFILRVNGQPVNEKITDQEWLSAGQGVYKYTTAKGTAVYYGSKGKAVRCDYNTGYGVKVLNTYLLSKPWPGESFATPLIIADSAKQLILINAYNNKRIITPAATSDDQLLYENKLYKHSYVYAADSIFFEHAMQVKCGHCTDGFNTKVVKEMVKGEVTYEYKTSTSYERGYETKWNPNTNTNQYVEVMKPVTSTQTIEHKQPDRMMDRTISVRCEKCNATGLVKKTEWLQWDGKKLKRPSFQ